MLRNIKTKDILKLLMLTLLILGLTLSSAACGDINDMLDILEGGNESREPIGSSGDTSDENGEVSVEVPDTAAELFVTGDYGEGLIINGYTGKDSFVKIPAEINGKAVTAISADAIKDVKSDGEEALYITEIVVPDTVEQIAFSAFSGCKKLSALTVPFVGGRADNHSYIGYVFGAYGAGTNNSFLPESLVKIQASGTVVADEAFLGCENIESITLYDVSSVGKNAFKGCTRLKTLHIPDTVTAISDGAFNGCESLMEISLPFLGNGSDKLFFGAVFGAEDYTQNLSFVPADLRTVSISCPADIPEGAFYECNRISKLTVKSAVNSVGEKAFYRCKKLKSLVIESEEFSGIKTLAPYAFAYCSTLGAVKLDGEITEIPEGAFYACSALRTVSFGDTDNAMPATVATMGKGAFAYCESLTAMELSSALTVIEEQAFYGCSYLLAANIPAGVTAIKDDAFKGCSNLKTLTVGDKLVSIGKGAFSYCSSLKSAVLPENVSEYGDYAFAYCAYLAELALQCNAAELGEGVFAGCDKIVITVKTDSETYNSLIESGMGNSNLKAPE